MKATRLVKVLAKAVVLAVVLAVGLQSLAADGWPLVTMRQMDCTSFTPEDMRAMIAINAKYPGSCDEYWLAEGYPFVQTAAVRRARASRWCVRVRTIPT